MAIDNTTAYLTRGTRFLVDGTTVPGVMNVTGLGSGGSAEIPITNLASTAVETAVGLPDGGTLSVDGIAAPQHPAFVAMRSAHKSGVEVICSVTVGSVPSGEKVTDGSGIIVHEDRAMTAALESTKLVITDANPDSLKAVTLGDYVSYGAVNTPITSITKTANGASVKFGTDATVTTSETEYDIIRPAVKYGFTARIASFEISVATDEVVRYTISLRVTGDVVTTIGTPDVA